VLAESLLRQNQGAKALEVLAPLLGSEANDPAIYALAGEASANIGDFAQATRWYTKAADLAPSNVDLLARKALIRVGGGSVDDGLDEWSGALQMAKDVTKADELLILGYLGKKRIADAADALQSLEKRAPNNPVTANLRGLVLLAKGDRAGAEQAFDAAL